MGMTDAVVFDGDESVGFYGNPSGFIQDTKRLTVNTYYTPWLVALVPGMNLAGADVVSAIGSRQAVGLRYSQFTAPQITGSVSNGITERYMQVNYAYNLSKSFNLGVAFKYVYSAFNNPINSSQFEGQSIAGDIGLSYSNDIPLSDLEVLYRAGLCINNLGSKISYSNSPGSDFLPTTLKLGNGVSTSIEIADARLNINWIVQVQKLLVPTPPVYFPFNSGHPEIASGLNPNVGVVQGAMQSFYDAPGYVSIDPNTSEFSVEKGSRFKEELNEVALQSGIEQSIDFLDGKGGFTLRQGLFLEHQTKGNRKFVTLGSSIGLYGFELSSTLLLPITTASTILRTVFFQFGYRFTFDAA
ncbi:MAG: type IX secretion system outer membrane channel protein PorV [Salibacteraceae bacterium]